MRPLRSAPVEVQVSGNGSIDVLTARDLNVTGVGVYLPHHLESCDGEAELDLVITLPGQRPFLAGGVVKHRTLEEEPPCYCGLAFTRIADDHREKLKAYVESRLNKWA